MNEPQSTSLGPTGKSACPFCQNSAQNGVPAGSDDLRRCATCKVIFKVNPDELLKEYQDVIDHFPEDEKYIIVVSPGLYYVKYGQYSRDRNKAQVFESIGEARGDVKNCLWAVAPK